MGQMLNVVRHYAEQAWCQTGAMPNGPNAVKDQHQHFILHGTHWRTLTFCGICD